MLIFFEFVHRLVAFERHNCLALAVSLLVDVLLAVFFTRVFVCLALDHSAEFGFPGLELLG